jgi:hypothetical protein
MYEWLPPDIELMTDTSAADWVVSRLRPWDPDGVRVASFMPNVFDGYARILHPAGARGGEDRGLRWSEVAARLGTDLHPEDNFWDLVGGPDADLYNNAVLGDIEPSSGTLPLPLLRALVEVLSRWTGQDEPCWFAMWDGWGSWWKGAHSGHDPFREERDAVLSLTPRVHASARDHFLMRGPFRAVIPLEDAASGQTPALWWPDGRSWLVSTEVDAFSTYIGGQEDLIDALLNSDELEAVPSRLDALLDWGL